LRHIFSQFLDFEYSSLIGKMHLKCSGILEVAEANNIIVLFPQGAVGISSISSVIQCWDFVGYTGPIIVGHILINYCASLYFCRFFNFVIDEQKRDYK